MFGLEKYKNIFGLPGQGAHSHRIFGLATVDILGTVVIIFLLSRYLNASLLKTTVGVVLFTIFIHMIFGVDTKLNKILLESIKSNFC